MEIGKPIDLTEINLHSYIKLENAQVLVVKVGRTQGLQLVYRSSVLYEHIALDFNKRCGKALC